MPGEHKSILQCGRGNPSGRMFWWNVAQENQCTLLHSTACIAQLQRCRQDPFRLAGLRASVCRTFFNALHPSVHVTTFASPKVGNHAFASSFSTAIRCYWNLFTYGDVVHYAPRKWMALLKLQGPYKHAEKKVRIDEPGTLDLDLQAIDFSGVQVGWPEVRMANCLQQLP